LTNNDFCFILVSRFFVEGKYEVTDKFQVYGNHEQNTIEQMRRCMEHESAIRGVLCADGHLGYSQPVGAAIAYEKHISISGVGYDQACGNLAVKTEIPFAAISDEVSEIASDISKRISFGVGQANNTKVKCCLFDDHQIWRDVGAEDLKTKAASQLGTVGSGNHYVDLFEDREDGLVWVGVHFGSRGLGHTLTTRFLKEAGGKDGIDQPATLIHEDSDIGIRYKKALEMTGEYAYAGRDWVVEQVLEILGNPKVLKSAHNHHNWSWQENVDNYTANVVRKGCTPIYPGQLSFVGGSMGDDAVILTAKSSSSYSPTLNSTVHGAGRVMGRNAAKKTFKREDMHRWLQDSGVYLVGGDLDESPMAYRRLHEVLAFHEDTISIVHKLRPFLVLMAGKDIVDPFKD
jgi:tRNA-splicing ligase RtcB (3'-phosphate/5'-hydroxy nucleic acid ligase)